MKIEGAGDKHGFHRCLITYSFHDTQETVKHHHGLHPGVIELIVELHLGIHWVDIHHHQSGFKSTVGHHQVLDQAGHLNGQTVTGL